MPHADDTLFIILHLPRTGGTALSKTLSTYLPPHTIQHVFFHPDIDDIWTKPAFTNRAAISAYIQKLSPERRAEIRILNGHEIFYGIHELFPERPYRYVIVFRDPVDQLVSIYNFLRGYEPYGPRMLRSSAGGVISFEEYIRKPDFLCKFLYHRMTGDDLSYRTLLLDPALCTDAHYQTVIDTLDRFYFIGISERSVQDHTIIQNMIGVPTSQVIENRSKKYYQPQDREKLRKTIQHYHPYTMKLYSYALARNDAFKRDHPVQIA